MHYYTPELWTALNSDNEIERADAERQWEKNVTAYALQLRKDMNKMPVKTRRAIREIDKKWEGLHDFSVQEMIFQNKVRRHSKARAAFGHPIYSYLRQCTLHLNNGIVEIKILLENVTSFHMTMDYHQDGRGDNWLGYCEFSYKEAQIELEILWDSYDIWQFCFENMEIESKYLDGSHL